MISVEKRSAAQVILESPGQCWTLLGQTQQMIAHAAQHSSDALLAGPLGVDDLAWVSSHDRILKVRAAYLAKVKANIKAAADKAGITISDS